MTYRSSADNAMDRERALFSALDADGDGVVTFDEVSSGLARHGLLAEDPRLSASFAEAACTQGGLHFDAFCKFVRPSILLIEKALTGGLVIPEFDRFLAELDTIFDAALADTSGTIADYIPQLARVDPERFGAAVCTIDGQSWTRGDANVDFCVQSCCKPINYALALEEHGEEYVHRHVGREPSGHGFNELTLNSSGLPHNPMVNAGAIMCCAMIQPGLPIADRFDHVMDRWRALARGRATRRSHEDRRSARA
jgi:glutaminase